MTWYLSSYQVNYPYRQAKTACSLVLKSAAAWFFASESDQICELRLMLLEQKGHRSLKSSAIILFSGTKSESANEMAQSDIEQ